MEEQVKANQEQAPDLKDLKSVSDEKKEERNRSKVSVTLIGAGGCGRNLLKKIGTNDSAINVVGIDTADNDIDFVDVPTYIISGEGSGKMKATNIDAINRAISAELFKGDNSENDILTELSDINIVLFSLSGGSGNVIASYLIQELNRRNKVAIAVGVSDSISELDANNSYKTMLSLQHIVKSNNLYLPMMLFNNDKSRSKVDETIAYRVRMLISMLTCSVRELDKNDKINFFSPDKTIGAPARIAGLHIRGMEDDHTEESGEVTYEKDSGYMYDSICHICQDDSKTLPIEMRSIFFGVLQNPAHSQEEYVCLLGFDIPRQYYDKIESDVTKFKQIDKARSEELKDMGFEDTKGGVFI